jgi:hypothetical protein
MLIRRAEQQSSFRRSTGIYPEFGVLTAKSATRAGDVTRPAFAKARGEGI